MKGISIIGGTKNIYLLTNSKEKSIVVEVEKVLAFNSEIGLINAAAYCKV